MKWLKSTSSMRYTVEGKVIPNNTEEPLQVTDDFAESLQNKAVIASLLKNSAILILDSYTSQATTLADSEKRLRSQIALTESLQAEIAELKKTSNPEIVERAKRADDLTAALQKQQDENAALQSQLETLQKQFKELQAEANAKIAELSE